jgi:tetratricopeptide (TPR) repeat protein
MDPGSPANDAQPGEHISSLINEYFERRQAGEELTPEHFAAEHPEVADELRPYLVGMALVDQARASATEALAADEDAVTPRQLPKIAGYELIEQIGRGGMGIVYKALQLSTKRIVALKVMLAGPFASPSARRRFDREVELAARLQHPSIVSVLEGGEVAGQRYFAMEYVDGVRLDHYLSDWQSDPRAALRLYARICEAVEYAHGRGVVHRDLKPGNVFVDDEGNPHILDFGLAKATAEAEMEDAPVTPVSVPGQVVGTLHYLSPEQAAGTPELVDDRTDVYALGVMLFETLTGKLPFDTSGRPSEVMQRILETRPAPPSSFSDGIDADLETIVLKALEKERERRYQSAREMAEDLERYLQGEPILAHRPSSLYVLRKKLVKHRLAVTLGAAVVVLVLVGVMVRFRARQQELVQARFEALRCQKQLEGEGTTLVLAPARALWEQHPRLPEAQLVWAQAQDRNEETRNSGILLLERQLQSDRPGWVYRVLLAEMYRETGDAERAATLEAQAQREAPDTAEAWYLRSFATLDLLKALRCARETVRRRPSHVLAWCRLTRLRLRTGDPEGALRGADRLIELGQDLGEWTVFKGQVLVWQGRFQEAIEQYTRAVDTRAEARLFRAHAYRRVKEYSKAVDDYTKLMEDEGETTAYAWNYYQRATPLWILGRTDEALEDYRRARILLGRPFYSDARSYLILRQLGRQGEAEAVLDAALRDVPASWLRRVFRCLAGQITPEALIAAAEAAPRDQAQKLCEAYYYAAEVHLLSGRADEARKCFERCVQTGVEFAPDTLLATPMNEYELAQWRLETLPAGVPTSQP